MPKRKQPVKFDGPLEYTHLDSNNPDKSQGKPHPPGIVPPPVPPFAPESAQQADPELGELLELWPTLSPSKRSRLLAIGRAMVNRGVS
ncbi:MAG: hypothetical protein RLZZ396_6 [Planctomycetota bacterium]